MFYQTITEYPKASMKDKTYSEQKKNIKTLAWNCTGQYLITGDTTIKIWNYDGNNLKKHTDIKGSEQFETLLFHPSQPDIIASVTKEHTKVWDIRSKAPVRQEKKEFLGIATWSPDGNTLALGTKSNKEQSITLLDLGGNAERVLTYQQKEKSEKNQMFELKHLQYDPLGDILLAGGAQNNAGVFQILNAKNPELPPLETIEGHRMSITTSVFSPDGNYLVTGGGDSLILIWQLPELICVRSIISIDSEIKSLSISYDSKWIAAFGTDEYLYIYSLEKCLQGQTDHIDTYKCESLPYSVVFHPNKTVMAFVCQDKLKQDSVLHLYGQQSV